jgi:hypothetical protein
VQTCPVTTQVHIVSCNAIYESLRCTSNQSKLFDSSPQDCGECLQNTPRNVITFMASTSMYLVLTPASAVADLMRCVGYVAPKKLYEKCVSSKENLSRSQVSYMNRSDSSSEEEISIVCNESMVTAIQPQPEQIKLN